MKPHHWRPRCRRVAGAARRASGDRVHHAAGRRPTRHGLEPVRARPAGHARRPAGHRPPDLRARRSCTTAIYDAGRGPRRPTCAPRDAARRRRRARHARRAVSGAARADRPASTPTARSALRPAGAHARPACAIGQRVAAPSSLARAADGADRRPLPFTPGTAPATTSSPRPPSPSPAFTHWARVRRSCCAAPNQFRPPAPPAAHQREVRGGDQRGQGARRGHRSMRTADQTQIGLFWNPPIWATWNRIARPRRSPTTAACCATRATFATLNLTFADAVIAFYDAKYSLPLLAAGHGDPRRGRRRQPGHDRRPGVDAAVEHRARPVLPGRARRRSAPPPPTCSPRSTATRAAFSADSPRAAGRRAELRQLLRGGAGGQRQPHLQRQPHAPGRGGGREPRPRRRGVRAPAPRRATGRALRAAHVQSPRRPPPRGAAALRSSASRLIM